MHETLLVLERLYELDAEVDERRHSLQGMRAAVARTDADLETAAAELRELDARRDALVAQEEDLQARLDRYIMRRDRTRTQLDQGLITDLLVAQRQLDNFAGIIDELELSVLDVMEQREALANKRMAVDQRRRLLVIRRDKEAARLDDEGGAHQERIDALLATRPDRVESVPQHVLLDYQGVRATHSDALSKLKAGNCTACFMHHPPQVVLEVRRGKRIHHCRGCNRFLVGIEEPAAETPDDGDEG